MKNNKPKSADVLQFKRQPNKFPQPIIEAKVGPLSFRGCIKEAIDLIQITQDSFDTPVIMKHLSIKLKEKLSEFGILDANAQCVEPNPYQLKSCPSCGQIGDGVDRLNCCDGTQTDDEEEE